MEMRTQGTKRTEGQMVMHKMLQSLGVGLNWKGNSLFQSLGRKQTGRAVPLQQSEVLSSGPSCWLQATELLRAKAEAQTKAGDSKLGGPSRWQV